jgi:hypothetical protein
MRASMGEVDANGELLPRRECPVDELGPKDKFCWIWWLAELFDDDPQIRASEREGAEEEGELCRGEGPAP